MGDTYHTKILQLSRHTTKQTSKEVNFLAKQITHSQTETEIKQKENKLKLVTRKKEGKEK